ncbi:hypothetical protein BaRGS_00027898, partial [Batillaria attramentaria]
PLPPAYEPPQQAMYPPHHPQAMATHPPSHPQPVVMQPQPMMQHSPVTTVVMNQEAARPKGPRPWSSGLLACCDDCGICWCVFFCGPCAGCRLSSDMGENVCLPCCLPNFMIPLRTKLRTQLNIHGSICDDCVATTCCPNCAMCQLMRELKLARATGQLP